MWAGVTQTRGLWEVREGGQGPGGRKLWGKGGLGGL